MLNKCCFCIGVRTATLILASLGALANFSNAWRLSGMSSDQYGTFYSLMATYYLGIGMVCSAGFFGVLKNKTNYVRLYAYYYWMQLFMSMIMSIVFSILAFHYDKDICEKLIQDPDMNITLDQCLDLYIKTGITMVILLAFTCIIELHFCLAVWAYYQKIRSDEFDQNPGINNIYYSAIPAYHVNPPPSYDTIGQTNTGEKFPGKQ
ncbi:hypothetical protein G9A89_019335 [Geosiphon pyriformis]|nr:hypothetical protein G9A89_019335 [Geosiphon pyriformis]